MNKRIIIDCDPGNGIPGANTDDGLALALALASPQLTLEMITTVSGNTPCHIGASVAANLLARLNHSVPVYQGATRALCEDPAPWRERLDRYAHVPEIAALWRNVSRPDYLAPGAQDAPEQIARLVMANPGEITLLAIGPLTNVATALLRYSQIASQLAGIVIMGGVFAVDGYLKDTNFGLDPEAADIVLSSGANITLVPMDVTVHTMLTAADLQRITVYKHPLTDFLRETLAPWIEFSKQLRGLPGCWIHDALVVAILLDDQLTTSARFQMGVELHNPVTRGKSWRYKMPLSLTVGIPAGAGSPVEIITSVNNQRLIDLLAGAFSAQSLSVIQ